jgi:hypothetical protein
MEIIGPTRLYFDNSIAYRNRGILIGDFELG